MKASTDFPVHEIIAGRWSPYAYSERPLAEADLLSVFEAARWASSSYNEQPWAFLVARREEPEAFTRMLGTLVEANVAWAQKAPVLALGLAHRDFSRNGKPNRHALYDLGQATATLALEASARGLAVHQMGGMLPEKARELYALPEDWEAVAALAIGYPEHGAGAVSGQDAERRGRKPLAEMIFSDSFGDPAGWLHTNSRVAAG